MEKMWFVIFENALRQAARYGAQCALLRDHDMEEDYKKVRIAYLSFRDQFENALTQEKITDAFWSAFGKA